MACGLKDGKGTDARNYNLNVERDKSLNIRGLQSCNYG